MMMEAMKPQWAQEAQRKTARIRSSFVVKLGLRRAHCRATVCPRHDATLSLLLPISPSPLSLPRLCFHARQSHRETGFAHTHDLGSGTDSSSRTSPQGRAWRTIYDKDMP